MVNTQLKLEGQTITRVSFDGAITLLTSSNNQIRIETTATIESAGQAAVPFDPEEPGQIASWLVSLLNSQITVVNISEAGLLAIGFEGDATLRASPDPDYEAWEIIGPGSERVVCMPGGGVARWSGA